MRAYDGAREQQGGPGRGYADAEVRWCHIFPSELHHVGTFITTVVISNKCVTHKLGTDRTYLAIARMQTVWGWAKKHFLVCISIALLCTGAGSCDLRGRCSLFPFFALECSCVSAHLAAISYASFEPRNRTLWLSWSSTSCVCVLFPAPFSSKCTWFSPLWW